MEISVKVTLEFGPQVLGFIERLVGKGVLATAVVENEVVPVPKEPPVEAAKEKHPPPEGVVERPHEWTNEQVLCLATMKALGATWPEICDAVNAYPGLRKFTLKACEQKYIKLKKAGKLPKITREPVAARVIAKPAPVVAKVMQKPVIAPPVPPKPAPVGTVKASVAEVRAWASQRGLCNGSRADLDMRRVNAKRAELGMQAFDLHHRRGA